MGRLSSGHVQRAEAGRLTNRSPTRMVQRGSAWLSMRRARAALARTGKRPGEAVALIHQMLSKGSWTNRAARVHIDFPNEPPGEWTNQQVPAEILNACPLPPLGHVFWKSGDVQFSLLPASEAPGHPFSAADNALSLDPIPPLVTISGLKVSSNELEALCRTIRGTQGRGRRKGAGSFAGMDEHILAQMRELLIAKAVASASEAASRFVESAAGGGTRESKIKRLAKRYWERYPER
jgi:hypothetical protein